MAMLTKSVPQAQRSRFHIPAMDCPSEEQMVRLRLVDPSVLTLTFDLPRRELTVLHVCTAEQILAWLQPLGFGARWLSTEEASPEPSERVPANARSEARVLWLLLGLNAAMFVVEVLAGWWGRSAGLVSDGADMLADATVYGVALWAFGRTARHQMRAARVAAVLQAMLALGALFQVGLRVQHGGLPQEDTMVGVSLLALGVNITCLWLASRHRGAGVHMRASYIFSANDVLANVGVIAAGALVAWSGSAWPDWVIGTAIAALVLLGAAKIWRLR